MERGLLDVIDHKVLGLARDAFERGGSPERLARGSSAGLVAAFLPSSALRFVAAFLAALFFRGNKLAALIAPALAGIFELRGVATLVTGIGTVIWPGGTPQVRSGAQALYAANSAWTWLHPLNSLQEQLTTLDSLSAGVLTALCGAALLLGVIVASSTYPVTLVALTFFYDAKLRTQAYLPWGKPKAHKPFVIPPPGALEAPLNMEQLRVRYCGSKTRFFTADSVRLLIDGGQAFPEMLAAIDSAREIVVLETYILRDDKYGTIFANALSAAAKRGVNTRLIYDGVGSMKLPDPFVESLTRAGVKVHVYHPLWSFLRRGVDFLQRRDHRKILVADRHVSLLGGLNIADEYAPVEDGGGGWRDTHVRIDGKEAARQLTRIFEETWSAAERAKLRKRMPLKQKLIQVFATAALAGAAPEDVLAVTSGGAKEASPDHPGTDSPQADGKPLPTFTSRAVSVEILSNRELRMRMRIKRAYLRAIQAAHRYILIENAFFIPDRDVLRALYAAARRGVVVGVVVAMKHDVRIAALASRALYDELLVHGVRLFEYPISMIHSKVAVIDDRWAIVSSYNLNHRSLLHDLEVGALFFDERFAVAVRDQILQDIGKCNEISKDLHRARPWNIALAESICYQFRYWL